MNVDSNAPFASSSEETSVSSSCFTDADGYLRLSRDWRYKCKTCSKAFVLLANLNRHVETYHRNNDDGGLTCYSCDTCGKSYLTNSLLKRHQTVKQHGDGIASSNNGDPKQFECQECPNSYFLSKSLARHVRQAHCRKPTAICHPSPSPFSAQDSPILVSNQSILQEIAQTEFGAQIEAQLLFLLSRQNGESSALSQPSSPRYAIRVVSSSCPSTQFFQVNVLVRSVFSLPPRIACHTKTIFLFERLENCDDDSIMIIFALFLQEYPGGEIINEEDASFVPLSNRRSVFVSELGSPGFLTSHPYYEATFRTFIVAFLNAVQLSHSFDRVFFPNSANPGLFYQPSNPNLSSSNYNVASYASLLAAFEQARLNGTIASYASLADWSLANCANQVPYFCGRNWSTQIERLVVEMLNATRQNLLQFPGQCSDALTLFTLQLVRLCSQFFAVQFAANTNNFDGSSGGTEEFAEIMKTPSFLTSAELFLAACQRNKWTFDDAPSAFRSSSLIIRAIKTQPAQSNN